MPCNCIGMSLRSVHAVTVMSRSTNFYFLKRFVFATRTEHERRGRWAWRVHYGHDARGHNIYTFIRRFQPDRYPLHNIVNMSDLSVSWNGVFLSFLVPSFSSFAVFHVPSFFVVIRCVLVSLVYSLIVFGLVYDTGVICYDSPWHIPLSRVAFSH